MFKKDWLTYLITEVKLIEKKWFIALDWFEWLIIKNRIPLNFSTEKEIEEMQTVEKENLLVERIPWEKEGDAPTATTVNRPIFEEVKTGNFIPNENYCEPTIEAVIKFVEKKLYS